MQLVFVIVNLSQLQSLKQEHGDNSTFPTISVLIPARNEANNIIDSLHSILQQSVPPLEILVLDDHSSDQTAILVEEIAKEHPSVRLITGEALPSGWQGKSHACHQLAQAAQGEWLLFLDADVRLSKHVLAAVGPTIKKQKTGMISGFPKQVVGSWMEKLVVSMMMFVIICHLPIRLVRTSQDSKFSAAHGGFILIEQSSYWQVGGHETIREALLDDMEMIKAVKKAGIPANLMKIDRYVSMRMYHNQREVWRGYQKNIFAGLNKNIGLMLSVVIYYFTLYLLPFGVLLYGIVVGELYVWALSAYLLAVITKTISDVSNRMLPLYGVFIPFSVFLVLAIGIDSACKSFSKQGYEWKGRRYF